MTPIKAMFYEFRFLFSGKGMPYDKVALMVALVCSVLFTITFHYNYSKEAPVAVIDLDNSRYSHELITKIDASPYMEVQTVMNTPIDPNTMFYNDKCVAVVYFPQNFEKEYYASSKADVGVFYDNTNTAQSAGIKESLNEILGTETAMMYGGENGGLSLVDRALYNPQDSGADGEILGFLFFFSSMFFVFATIGMVPRLRMTGELERHLREGTPLDLMARIVPYGAILIGALFIGMVVLKYFNDLTFSGNPFFFLLLQIFYVWMLGMMSLWFGWYSPNPGIASSKMILFIPGGFIFGGQTGPLTTIDPIVRHITHVFPLIWEFELIRDIILRGAGFWDCAVLIGQFLLYCCVVACLFIKRFYTAKAELEQAATDNDFAD